ncbi:hypothetical protein BJ508DRAFT_360407 [Ascobolus immersus RN42]|uniref:Uncharacterized protein n=1 Tax=Ascobolus immersus RN42 TaxID=1160509 RepID=A0A3N4ID21_ASCIM|nr:hypothetical protein BJ508DRAFT_360407 [Ascobolus immersus RN42]
MRRPVSSDGLAVDEESDEDGEKGANQRDKDEVDSPNVAVRETLEEAPKEEESGLSIGFDSTPPSSLSILLSSNNKKTNKEPVANKAISPATHKTSLTAPATFLLTLRNFQNLTTTATNATASKANDTPRYASTLMMKESRPKHHRKIPLYQPSRQSPL